MTQIRSCKSCKYIAKYEDGISTGFCCKHPIKPYMQGKEMTGFFSCDQHKFKIREEKKSKIQNNDEIRRLILDKAKQCVCGDRDEQYGDPKKSFALIAELWQVYLGVTIKPKDAAIMMTLFKIARTKYKHKLDNYIDMAGYAAIAGELADKK